MRDIRLADSVPDAPERSSGEWRSLAEVLGIELERIDRLAAIAWRLYDDRQFREAAAVFRGLWQLDPENIDLYRGYSLAAAKDHDLLAATLALDQALLLLDGKADREQDRGQLLALRAAFLYRAGKKREAIESAEASLSWAPTAPWSESLRRGLQRAGGAPAERGPSAEALASLQEALVPRLEEVTAGRQTLAWAIGYGDDELLHVFHNGAALLEVGHATRARRIFEGLVALDADVPLFHLALAASWEAVGEAERACSAYEAAVGAAREVEDGADLLADTLVRRARHLAQKQCTAEALGDLDEALALPAAAVPEDLRAHARALREALAKGAPNPAPPR